MNCPKCDEPAHPHDRFCAECGTHLENSTPDLYHLDDVDKTVLSPRYRVSEDAETVKVTTIEAPRPTYGKRSKSTDREMTAELPALTKDTVTTPPPTYNYKPLFLVGTAITVAVIACIIALGGLVVAIMMFYQ